MDRLAVHDPDHDWDRHTNATFAALGSRAAEQGVVLRALVDLYLSAAWRAWPQLPAVAGEDATAMRAAGQRVLRACDDAVAALAEGVHRYTLHTAVLGARAIGWPGNAEFLAESRT